MYGAGCWVCGLEVQHVDCRRLKERLQSLVHVLVYLYTTYMCHEGVPLLVDHLSKAHVCTLWVRGPCGNPSSSFVEVMSCAKGRS